MDKIIEILIALIFQSKSQGIAYGTNPEVELPKHSTFQNEVMQYAFYTSNLDKEFLYMLKSENGNISPTTKSKSCATIKGVEGCFYDYGFCQMNEYYQKEIVSDPKFFEDWHWQVDQCHRLWENRKPTTFYAYRRIETDPNFRKTIEAFFVFKEVK
jgi:hypothetical protein